MTTRFLPHAANLLIGIAIGCVLPRAYAGIQNVSKQDVLRAPAPLEFSPWKQVADLVAGPEYLESFPSPVVSGYPKNDSVPLRIFVPANPSGPVPVVLIAHYWGATDLKAETALASNLNERGVAAAILTLPYHLERTPTGAKSGMMAIQPDPDKLRQMMYQSEEDARRAMDFLDTRKEFKHDGYGFCGISLGALVAALTYAVDPRVKFTTFALGGADLAHILWNSSRTVVQKEVLRRQGWDEAKLRSALEPVEPLTYLNKSTLAKSFVIEGKFDSVMPRQSTEELIAQLQDPQVLRLETGHYGGIFVQGKILRTVADFFSVSMTSGKPYVAPNRFSAVTLRIGGLLDTPNGVDLGVGVDIFHLDPAGTRFGDLFLTPRGLRLFLGQSLGGGFSIGLVGSFKGPGAGLMWSIVL